MVPRTRDEKHYSPRLEEVTYWLLALETSIRFISEVSTSYITLKILDWLIILGSVSQVLAGFLFIYNMWSRVRSLGKQT